MRFAQKAGQKWGKMDISYIKNIFSKKFKKPIDNLKQKLYNTIVDAGVAESADAHV